MPQMNKGGKFIFWKIHYRGGWKNTISDTGNPGIPHNIRAKDFTFFTGSKSTGGFLRHSKKVLLFYLQNWDISLTEQHQLFKLHSSSRENFVWYKGRAYCWVEISEHGTIQLPQETIEIFLEIKPGMSLLSIRSSDIAFTMGAKGPLLKKAEEF